MRDGGLPDLTGQRVLITGASGHIGAGIARRFAAAGAAVAVHARREDDRINGLVDELRSITTTTAEGAHPHTSTTDRPEFLKAGAMTTAVFADLDAAGAADDLVAQAVRALGGLDGLVNNAGVQPVTPLAALTRAEWDAVHRTNLSAVFDLSRAAASVMARGSWITHIASVEASRPASGHAHYAAAKAGVVMHARAAALEYGPHGIRVNTVSPGLIDRPGLAEDWPAGVASWLAQVPLGRLGSAEDVGNACVLLASPAASFITGQDLAVDGGMLTTPGW
ncbi:MAG: SDR family NAD(P)-dependent oxidoreductase [Propioniciclava sp.]|uniref:SDR family NAD(P)-dependent oxidoreductase n=1 Tax=Propioniciclava sp. TaxID=2038686 RepID=UPI0039E24193